MNVNKTSIFQLSGYMQIKLFACILVALSMMACQNEQIDPLDSIEDVDGQVSFKDDIQPIFTGTCGNAGCHITSSTSGVNMESYSAIMNSVGAQYGEKIVEAGKATAANSPLVDKLVSAAPRFGTRMPLGRSALTNQQISLIVAWIEQGAQNN